MDAKVLEILKRNGPLHIGAIADRCDARPYRVEQCCNRLFRQGYVTTERCGVYRITPRGRQYGSGNESPSSAD